MDDLISRQAAINALENTDCELSADAWDELTDAIMELPSAQPEQIVAKQILWMEIKEKPSFTSYTPHCKCSNCGHELILKNITYCYVCGARLVGKEKI